MRRILILITAIALTIGGTVAAAPANAATCTNVWLTTPSYDHKLLAGTKRCVWFNDRTAEGWIRIHRLDNRDLRTIDWLNPYNYTRIPPNNGLYKPNADRARALAKKHNVRLQFAVSNVGGTVGCTAAHYWQLSGTYSGSYRHPGEGLVRIGTGTTSRCMRNQTDVMDTTRHELTHALIERLCPDAPAEPRHENVTDAFAWKYLDATVRNPGGYGFTRSDLWRATKIHGGWCG